MAERLRSDSSRVLDGVRQSGNVGYLSAALSSQKFGWQFQAALWLQRRLGVNWPLAEEVANRFELFLVKQLMLRELTSFCDTQVAELIGNHAAVTVRKPLKGARKRLAVRLNHSTCNIRISRERCGPDTWIACRLGLKRQSIADSWSSH